MNPTLSQVLEAVCWIVAIGAGVSALVYLGAALVGFLQSGDEDV